MTSTSSATRQAPRPVPGGWYGAELAKDPAAWRLPLPGDVRDDLLRAAAALGRDGAGADPRQERPSVSERTRSLVADLRRRLTGDPGLVVHTGFPVREAPELTEAAYLVLGMLLGQPVRQLLDGSLLARVEVTPGDKLSGHGQPKALPYHVDRCTDVIGLLCVRSAQAGGRSLVVSSKTVHNILLERHPDLLSVLQQPIPVHVPEIWGPNGGQPPQWCSIPMFSQVDGHFAAYFARNLIEAAQQLPGPPRLTRQQLAALDAVDEVTAMPELPLEMALQPGDLQLVNNFSVLHSRTAYESDTPQQGRLLLRLHLAFAGSPALPAGYTTLFGTTAAGTYRGGVWRTAEIQDRFGAPLQPAGAA